MTPRQWYVRDPFGGIRFDDRGFVVSLYAGLLVTRIHGFALYDLGAVLRALKDLSQGILITDVFMVLMQARGNLPGPFSESGPYRLPLSREAAQKLADHLDSFMWDPAGPRTFVVGARFIGSADPTRRLSVHEAEQSKKDLDALETVMQAEMGASDIWAVSEKGLYSTRKLVDSAHEALTDKAIKVIWPNAINDYAEAGKCIAFDRFTASGFHSLRSLESVIKQYVLTATGSLPPINRQNWGEYITQLKNSKASAATIGTLQIIKDNHRNPLMHPEDTLDVREAIALFQLCGMSIVELVDEMFTRGLTPSPHP